MPDNADFGVDPNDMEQYIKLLRMTAHRDADDQLKTLRDETFDGGLDAENGGPKPTAGMHGYITEDWAAHHKELHSAMVETLFDAGTALQHYQDALTAIREAYLSVDEDNRCKIDKVWAKGHDDNDNAERDKDDKQSKNAFDYKFADYGSANLEFEVASPASFFDGLDPTGGVGMDIAAPKSWLLNVLGIDIEDFVRHYIGPWGELGLCASGARRFQLASLNIGDNAGTGMHDLDVTWDGVAAEQARLHIGNFTNSVNGQGYSEITELINQYNQGMYHIAQYASVSSKEWFLGIQMTGAALKILPDLAQLDSSSVKSSVKPQHLPAEQEVAEAVRDILLTIAKDGAKRYLVMAVAGLLFDAAGAIGFGNAAARNAHDVFDNQVKPAIKTAKKKVDGVEFPALHWTS
ncbi:MAG TPA: hypothetical protein VE172_17885 [Stackebrandtia sp.]|uniref:hypothetical protein n=1 Tax=Stackebrandtia sp. TaxID=2023065 RepID=UPI002D32BBB2|nr:hypothetical protein [Stackebrandtia sp.]HZE40676.1 hypothetical protein [Stackebrandtia sp.]